MTIRNQVAKLELLAVRRSGRRSVVAVSIGRQYEIHDGRGANRAACSISVRGLGPHRYNPRRILGEDTFQALSITLAFVRFCACVISLEPEIGCSSPTGSTDFRLRRTFRAMGASLIQALHPTAAAELSEAGGEGRVATPVGGRRFHASDVMDSHEARTVLGEAICRYRAMTSEKVQRLLKEQDCFRTRGASGVPYQIAVEAVWDNKPGGKPARLGAR